MRWAQQIYSMNGDNINAYKGEVAIPHSQWNAAWTT